MENIRNRYLGEIYTPKHISNLLYEITNKYIPNFNMTHTVWDCCWGTGNLTEDIEFVDLYVSTLRALDIRKNNRKNPTAKKFAYDFLEDDIEQLVSQQAMWVKEHKMPEDLLDKLNGDKPILFYINPPYVGTGVYGTNNTDFKDGATDSAVKEIMRQHVLESACDQTYTQFLYRIYLMKEAYRNKNISIAVICPPTFLSATTYKNFRDKFLKSFKFMGGALFQASEFSGLSIEWGITIQVWSPGETVDKKNFIFDAYEWCEDGQFRKTGEKNIYNIDGEIPGVDWIKSTINGFPQIMSNITLSSGCKMSNKKPVSTVPNALGYFYYKGNSVYHNEQECGIMSLPYSNGGGTPIIESNFDKVIAMFTARRAFSRYGSTWKNNKDEYLVPNENSDTYKTLLMNGYIYALFNGSSNMTSLILDTDEGKLEVPNHFFFLSAAQMKQLLDSVGLPVIGPGRLEDRLMYKKLQTAFQSGLLVDKAIQVYNAWVGAWVKTMPLRVDFHRRYPEFQVLNWDASFYQIRQIVKDNNIKDFAELNGLYREFEDSIRELVYDAGFLRK